MLSVLVGCSISLNYFCHLMSHCCTLDSQQANSTHSQPAKSTHHECRLEAQDLLSGTNACLAHARLTSLPQEHVYQPTKSPAMSAALRRRIGKPKQPT
jgi:hypothetical protein